MQFLLKDENFKKIFLITSATLLLGLSWMHMRLREIEIYYPNIKDQIFRQEERFEKLSAVAHEKLTEEVIMKAREHCSRMINEQLVKKGLR